MGCSFTYFPRLSHPSPFFAWENAGTSNSGDRVPERTAEECDRHRRLLASPFRDGRASKRNHRWLRRRGWPRLSRISSDHPYCCCCCLCGSARCFLLTLDYCCLLGVVFAIVLDKCLPDSGWSLLAEFCFLFVVVIVAPIGKAEARIDRLVHISAVFWYNE